MSASPEMEVTQHTGATSMGETPRPRESPPDDIVISARDLGKMYHLYDRPQDRLKQAFLWGWRQYYREFWALRELSLDVCRGEVLGIIGRNGSGKSTFLQILAGVLKPTTGYAEVHGRVAALLELGSGFNPEFSGRENIYMNAAILGMPRGQIDQRYEQILRFSEIAPFIDQPIKTYSSGMIMRLAFAISVNVDADILVVDEALAVGDEAFQRKCYARLRDLQMRGATVLFVSHSTRTVIEFCSRAVLLDQGEMLLSGVPAHVVSQYHKLLFAPSNKVEGLRRQIRNETEPDRQPANVANVGSALRTISPEGPQSGPCTQAPEEHFAAGMVSRSTTSYLPRGARIENVRILNEQGEQVNLLVSGRRYRYCYSVHFDEPAWRVRFSMLIKTITGIELGGAHSHPESGAIESIAGGTTVEVSFAFTCRLTTGAYFLNAGVKGWEDGQEVYLHRVIDAMMFKVQPVPDALPTLYVDFEIEPSVQEVPAEPAGSPAS